VWGKFLFKNSDEVIIQTGKNRPLCAEVCVALRLRTC
jgi:hypothetical protein